MTGSLLLGACVIIWCVLCIARVQAERHREQTQYTHDNAIALGPDLYFTARSYGPLPAEQRTASDAIDAQAQSVSPGHRLSPCPHRTSWNTPPSTSYPLRSRALDGAYSVGTLHAQVVWWHPDHRCFPVSHACVSHNTRQRGRLLGSTWRYGSDIVHKCIVFVDSGPLKLLLGKSVCGTARLPTARPQWHRALPGDRGPSRNLSGHPCRRSHRQRAPHSTWWRNFTRICNAGSSPTALSAWGVTPARTRCCWRSVVRKEGFVPPVRGGAWPRWPPISWRR